MPGVLNKIALFTYGVFTTTFVVGSYYVASNADVATESLRPVNIQVSALNESDLIFEHNQSSYSRFGYETVVRNLKSQIQKQTNNPDYWQEIDADIVARVFLNFSQGKRRAPEFEWREQYTDKRRVRVISGPYYEDYEGFCYDILLQRKGIGEDVSIEKMIFCKQDGEIFWSVLST